MVYDRNSRGDDPTGSDDGRYYASGRDYPASSARDYEASAEYGRGGGGYGQRDGGGRGYRGGYGEADRSGPGGRGYGRQAAGGGYGRQEQAGYGGRDTGGGFRGEWHGSYGSDSRQFEDVGRNRHADDDNYRSGRYPDQGRAGYGRQPQGYDYEDRGFFQRAGDEVRSWFGDDDAERRREADARYDERYDRSGAGRHDDDYRQWRNGQVSQFDRDYHEYRQENRQKFENEFSSWRTSRQGQRDQLKTVKEHAEVVGSDGAHVGTVDKTRDDRILLTKNDADAGGRHHSIPSRWIASVDDKTVTLSKTAAEAKAAWEDEDRNSAMFGYGDNRKGSRDDDRTDGGRDAQGRMLNRSFSGTY